MGREGSADGPFRNVNIITGEKIKHEGGAASNGKTLVPYFIKNYYLTLILRRSRTGTVWFYTSTSNKRAARPKLYTKSLTRDLKRM